MPDPKKTEICLGVRQSTSTTMMLGLLLSISSTMAVDTEHVFIVRHHPDHSRNRQL